MATNTLLDDIEEFLANHKITDTTFGRKTVNDWDFVRRLRKGGRCWPETEAKVREFMAGYKAEAA